MRLLTAAAPRRSAKNREQLRRNPQVARTPGAFYHQRGRLWTKFCSGGQKALYCSEERAPFSRGSDSLGMGAFCDHRSQRRMSRLEFLLERKEENLAKNRLFPSIADLFYSDSTAILSEIYKASRPGQASWSQKSIATTIFCLAVQYFFGDHRIQLR